MGSEMVYRTLSISIWVLSYVIHYFNLTCIVSMGLEDLCTYPVYDNIACFSSVSFCVSHVGNAPYLAMHVKVFPKLLSFGLNVKFNITAVLSAFLNCVYFEYILAKPLYLPCI